MSKDELKEFLIARNGDFHGGEKHGLCVTLTDHELGDLCTFADPPVHLKDVINASAALLVEAENE